MSYKPKMPFNVAMRLLIPEFVVIKGVRKKVYPEPEDGIPFFGSFRTFGGTESFSNGIYTVFDTAVIDTWYRSDFSADCEVYVCQNGKKYELASSPEDIDMKHQYMMLKVKAIGGSA